PPPMLVASCLVCFSFHCYRDRRALHSFPTRRSSDLRLSREGRELTLDAIAAEALVSRATAYRYFPSLEALLAEASLDLATPSPEDRKSTRLNSSHVKISYAVFCLKKKTQVSMNYKHE